MWRSLIEKNRLNEVLSYLPVKNGEAVLANLAHGTSGGRE